MLCWSWVCIWKMLNLPRGVSGNDSREVFYACMTPPGVCSMKENLSWCSTVFPASFTVFFSQVFITNKLKGCLCLGGEVRICALAIKADNPALQCQQERFNSFSHKSNFSFLGRGSLLSSLPLPLLCRHPWPPCRAERGGRIPRTLGWGWRGWPELSMHKV